MNQFWAKILPGLIYEQIEKRPDLRRVATNTGWLFADRLVRIGIGLGVSGWLARYLGPEQFGLFNYAIAFAALFSALATLSLDAIVVREIVRNPASQDEILGTTVALRLISGSVAFLVTVGSIFLLRPQESPARWLVVIMAITMLFQSADTIDLWFQSQVQSRYSVWVKNAAFVAMTLVRVGLILLQAPLTAFAWAYLAEMALGAVGLVSAYHARGRSLRAWRVTFNRSRQLLQESWPLMLSGLAIIIYMKVDQVMLGTLVGDKATGIYAAAVRISEIWYFIPTAIAVSIAPALIAAREIGERAYYQRLQELFRLMIGVALVITAPISLLSGWLVRLIFGDVYAASGAMLSVHIWATPFVFLGVTQGIWDVTEGLTRLALRRTVLGAVVNVLLNLILIPSLAGLGAAIATVAAYALSAYFANLLHPQTRRMFFLQTRSLFFLASSSRST